METPNKEIEAVYEIGRTIEGWKGRVTVTHVPTGVKKVFVLQDTFESEQLVKEELASIMLKVNQRIREAGLYCKEDIFN